MAEQTQRVTIVVHGWVQGVGFRAFARHRAEHLNLTGVAVNRADGSVEITAEGQRVPLQAFAQAVQGSDAPGRVDGVQVTWSAPTGEYTTFRER